MSIVDARMQPLAVAHGCSPSRRRTSFDNNTYKAGNQISNSGYTYDANGNLTNDGMSAYTWDRANRLLNVGAAGANVSKYDGLGNRVSRTNSGFTSNLLQDLQPGLAQNVAIGYPSLGNMARMVHTPFGVLAQEDNAGNWEWMLEDGLGSVRSVVNNALTVLEHRHFEPYGNLYAGTMNETPFGFTGEWRDSTTGMYYLRARYYAPGMGTFVSRDPYAGTTARAMSLNGYSWVEGRVADGRDPSGMDVNLARGCSNKTCEDFLQEMFEAIMGRGPGSVFKGLAQRFDELVDDICHFYERDVLNTPTPLSLLPTTCSSSTVSSTSWGGHLQQFRTGQNPLKTAIDCFRDRGQQLFNATGDTSRLCDQNDAIYQAAVPWNTVDVGVPGDGKMTPDRVGGRQANRPSDPPPPTPPAPPPPVSVPSTLSTFSGLAPLAGVAGGVLLGALALSGGGGGGVLSNSQRPQGVFPKC